MISLKYNKIKFDYWLLGKTNRFSRYDGKQNNYDRIQYYGFVFFIGNAASFTTKEEVEKYNRAIILKADII